MIRMLAMLSIIACHFCQYYDSEWAWWLNVGVQVFFIISGYLYGNRSVDAPIPWLKKRFMKILVPYYVFLTLAIIAYLIASPEKLGLINVASSYLVVGTIKGINHLWFVSYILFCYLITPYLATLREYFKKRDTISFFCYIVVIIGIYSIIEVGINGHFRPGMIGCYILGYYTAVFTKRLGYQTIRNCFLISLIPTIISNFVYCHIHYIQGLEMTGFLVHITDYSHAFLGYSITMFLMILFKNIREYRILGFSDRYSYEIYLVHQLFILSPLTLLTVTNTRSANILLTLLVIFSSGILLSQLNKKIMSLSIFSRDRKRESVQNQI